jgi:hypothetical protein
MNRDNPQRMQKGRGFTGASSLPQKAHAQKSAGRWLF